MNRLYGVNINEKQWRIKEIDDKNYHTYKLINKKTKEEYTIRNIIGIEQVDNNEFLIFRKSSGDNYEIRRCNLHKSHIETIFCEQLKYFTFITDDRILFKYIDRSARYRCEGIYSIKNNKMIEEAEWLNGTVIDTFIDPNDEIKLYVEEDIYSYGFVDNKLIFVVDSNTLEPCSECYSTFKNDFIKIDSKEDYFILKQEEESKIYKQAQKIKQEEQAKIEKAKSKIIKIKR